MSGEPARPALRGELLNPFALLANLWRRRDLALQMTVRDVAGRYRSTFLGMLWPVLIPLAMLAVYTFTFGIVFSAKWRIVRTDSPLEYAMTLFTGIILFGLFGETVGRSAQAIVSNVNYVKRVVFPLEILPVIQLGAAAIHAAVGYAVWLLCTLALVGPPPLTAFWFPLVFLAMAMLTLGLSWLVAALGVFVRDIGQAVAIALQVLFFTSAVFFSIEDVPQRMAWALKWNPVAILMENCRRTLMWGLPPDWPQMSYTFAVSGAVLQLGYYVFMRSKRAFSDVL